MGTGKVTVNQLSAEIEYLDILLKNATLAKELIQKGSPVGHRGRYRSGWKVSVKREVGGVAATVHNATDYQLAHLLESGHMIYAGSGVKRTAPQPHIKPAFDVGSKKYEYDMSRSKIKITVKEQ